MTRAKPILAVVGGFVYALIYGFWTLFITGGGHGNFIWIGLFLFTEFFGLYVPLMAFLALNLTTLFRKVVFGSFVCFNVISGIVMIAGWVNSPDEPDRASEFHRQLQINGLTFVLICAFIHFLPTVIFLTILIRSIVAPKAPIESNPTLLDLG